MGNWPVGFGGRLSRIACVFRVENRQAPQAIIREGEGDGGGGERFELYGGVGAQKAVVPDTRGSK